MNIREEIKAVGVTTDDENMAILHADVGSAWHVHLEAALLYDWPIAVQVDDLGMYHKMYVQSITPVNDYVCEIRLACDNYYMADEEKEKDAAHVFSS